MTIQPRAVSVEQLPEELDFRRIRRFFQRLESNMHEHPCIVIDCSKVRDIDGACTHLLLRCLEEAMKRNGDVRLAAIPADASQHRGPVALDRLFRIFDTTDQAVQSYHRRTARAIRSSRSTAAQKSANAA